jgi:putative ABC transport system permease protein
VTLLTAVLLGITPVMETNRHDVMTILKEEAAPIHGSLRLKQALVVVQTSFCILLLISAGLFIRSWQKSHQIDLGFNPKNILAFDIDLSKEDLSETEGVLFFDQLKQRIAALPGIKSVTFSDLAPVDLATPRIPVQIPGHNPPPGQVSLSISSNRIAPGYFDAMQLPLLKGQDFTDRTDSEQILSAIINEEMSRQYWHGADPIGQRIAVGKELRPAVIVGVAKNSKYRVPGESSTPHIYLSHRQLYESGMTVLVRTESNPKSFLRQIENSLASINPNIPAFFARTIDEHLAFSMLPSKVGGSLLAVFGILGLILACTGIYALISFQVTQRTREIGVRMAMGASRINILRSFITRGMRLTVGASAIGMIAAVAVAKYLAKLLVGISPDDPIVFVTVPFLLIIVSFLASALPAYRASKLDPWKALRYE